MRLRALTVLLAVCAVTATGCTQGGQSAGPGQATGATPTSGAPESGSTPVESGSAQSPSATQSGSAPQSGSATRPGASTPAARCAGSGDIRAKKAGALVSSTITGARAGTHACYDRLVIDLKGSRKPGYMVEYVKQVQTPGEGRPVPVKGAAVLQVVVLAPAYNDQGKPTWSPKKPAQAVDVSGFPALRQVALAGSFEGETTIAVGVAQRLPFSVHTMDGATKGTTRLVIDVAHTGAG